MSKLRIGNVELDNRVVLAPMAGVTDLPFRLICKEYGAGLMYTEMVSGKAILFHNKNTEELLTVDDTERPVALQLFGCEPEVLANAAAEIESRNFDILDINMGCPVAKVVNNHEGSSLMKNPRLIEDIVRAVSNRINKPVSVKLRKGFEKEDRTAVECALAAEAGGARLVAVHGRTREEFYSGKADWSIIEDVKKAVHIPVIGNGDIYTPEDAKRMIETTGCDGIMVGRGAQGNPWIFRRINAYLENGELLPEPTREERAEMVLRHAKAEIEFKGEYTGIREMRKHVAWYMSGFPGAVKVREGVNYIESYTELETMLRKICAN